MKIRPRHLNLGFYFIMRDQSRIIDYPIQKMFMFPQKQKKRKMWVQMTQNLWGRDRCHRQKRGSHAWNHGPQCPTPRVPLRTEVSAVCPYLKIFHLTGHSSCIFLLLIFVLASWSVIGPYNHIQSFLIYFTNNNWHFSLICTCTCSDF